MDLFYKKLGRRQFISVTSMALGAGMIMNSSQLFAQGRHMAENPQDIPGGSEPRRLRPIGTTKYGHNILIPPEVIKDYEHGTPIIQTGVNAFPEASFDGAVQSRMVPEMFSMYPAHAEPEKHDEKQEVLCMFGNNPDDPLDLGAEIEYFLGKGTLLEKHPMLTKSAVVVVPTGQWHWPWRVREITRAFNWINFNIPTRGQAETGAIPGSPPGAVGPGGNVRLMKPGESFGEEMQKAITDSSKFRFTHLVLSGVDKSIKAPKGGKWIAYTDMTRIAESPLIRVLRYYPDDAPYPVIGEQTHEYDAYFCLYGLETYDPDLGAEVDLYLGPEKEKYTINHSVFLYMPANTMHGPFIVKKARKPFFFMEIVGGPEQPGAVCNNELIYNKYNRYL